MSENKLSIGIVEFKTTNLFSIKEVLSRFGKVKKIDNHKKLKNIDILVIPGVGTFSGAMSYLRKNKLDREILKFANLGKKVLGICLGMQILLDTGYEIKKTKGLSLIKGEVKKFRDKSPNIGWDKIILTNGKKKRIDQFFYFVHSNYCYTEKKFVMAESKHNGKIFPAIIKNKNIIGIQFHPEKSGIKGINFLKKIIFNS